MPYGTCNKEEFVGYLISESTIDSSRVKISNIKDNKKWISFDTILQEADTVNRNRHLYEKVAINSAIKEEHFIERMKTGNLYGEAGHPLEPTRARQLYLDQTRISHRINNVWWEDGINLCGNVDTAFTDVGCNMANLIRQGSIPAFSMRGIGPVAIKENGYLRIKPPLTIFTYDWILYPSHRTAYMTSSNPYKDNPELNESTNIINESNNINIYRNIGKITKNEINKYISKNSKNIRLFSEAMEFENPIVKVNKHGYALVESNDIGASSRGYIKIEDHIRNEVQSFIKNL